MSNVSSVSGNSAVSSYSSDYSVDKKTEEKAAEVTEASKADGKGVVYEASEETEKKATYSVNKMSKEDRAALVSQLKADQEARQSQFVSMVQKLISGQTNAYGQANNIWQFLASGKFTVDPETQAQAQADIAEDGYYGVKQTAQRIVDFASALAGDDVDKMKQMQEAFEKGFKQAEKTWGGKLPDISYQTQDSVKQMFDDYYASRKAE